MVTAPLNFSIFNLIISPKSTTFLRVLSEWLGGQLELEIGKKTAEC